MRHRAKVWTYCGLDFTDVCCQGDIKEDQISLKGSCQTKLLVLVLVTL